MELLKAFKMVVERNPKRRVQLEIGGTGPLKNKIQRYIENNDLGDRVKILGFVKESNKSELLASADIAAFPSLGGESFGIVLTEAMANGSGVVIGGDNPGYRSVLKDDAFLFAPKDVAAFADKLEELIDDSKLRATLHDKQQKLVAKFDIETLGPKIMDVYQRAIANKSQ